MAVYEIPLSPKPQTVTTILGPKTYVLRFRYADADQGGWFVDILDQASVPLLCGLPLVTGTDLLEPYAADLGIPGRLWVTTDGDPDAVPTFDGLGVTSHLLFEPS